MEFINETIYTNLKNKTNSSSTRWILRNNLEVDPVINKLFIEDKFIRTICFNETFKLNGVDKPLSETSIGKLPTDYPELDHTYGVMLNEDNINLYDNMEYMFHGIFNFPYIRFEDALKISEDNGDLWITYIINPYLMKYNSSIGMFYCLNTDHITDIIKDINGYIRKHTGYDLFYKPTSNDKVDMINEDYPDTSLEKFVEIHTYPEKDNQIKSWNKLLKFWADNEEVECQVLDNALKYHQENMGYILYGIDWNLKTLNSTRKFIMIDNATGETLGPFNYFELDLSYNCIYTGNLGEYSLTDEQVLKFRNSVYDFKLI